MKRTALGRSVSLAALFAAATALPAFGQVPIFFDGFDVSEEAGTTNPGPTSTFDINADIGIPRQGGPFAPVSYVTSTADSSDNFGHQLFPPSNGNQPLQLAENGSNPPGAPPIFSYKTMVSPDFNFNGMSDSGVVGTRVTFDLDVGVIAEEVVAGVGTFVHAGITIGSGSTLVDSEDQIGVQEGLPIRDYFSIHFVEDFLVPNGLGTFAQAYADGFIIQDEGNSGVVIPHDGGVDPLSVQLDITDPTDDNPWNGVGSTIIDVSLNGTPIYSYEKTDGGYTDNYITLFGTRQFAGNGLATHTFDNLTVWAGYESPGVPGDANGDGNVDLLDLDLLGQQFNMSGPDLSADFNGDGTVDLLDLDILGQNFNGGGEAIPEPTAAVLALVGAMAVWRRR